MLFILLLTVLLIAFICFLFVPIVLFIDTSKKQYYIQMKGLAKASIESDECDIIRVHFNVLFFNFDVYPLRKWKTSDKKKIKKNSVKKKRSKSIPFKKIIGVLNSFKVKEFYLDIDSGDCIFNSKLYPVFACLNFYKATHCHVNFNGRNRLLLSVENRPIQIITSFINN